MGENVTNPPLTDTDKAFLGEKPTGKVEQATRLNMTMIAVIMALFGLIAIVVAIWTWASASTLPLVWGALAIGGIAIVWAWWAAGSLRAQKLREANQTPVEPEVTA